MKKALIMMCGIPASGKSTTARNLQDYLDHAPIVSMDDIRQEMFGTRKCQEQGYEVYQRSIEIVVKMFQSHDIIIYDATNRTRKSREQLVYDIQTYIDCNFYCVYLATDLKTALERNINRNEAIQVPNTVIERMDNSLQEPTLKEEYFKDVYKIYPQSFDCERYIVYNIYEHQLMED